MDREQEKMIAFILGRVDSVHRADVKTLLEQWSSDEANPSLTAKYLTGMMPKIMQSVIPAYKDEVSRLLQDIAYQSFLRTSFHALNTRSVGYGTW